SRRPISHSPTALLSSFPEYPSEPSRRASRLDPKQPRSSRPDALPSFRLSLPGRWLSTMPWNATKLDFPASRDPFLTFAAERYAVFCRPDGPRTSRTQGGLDLLVRHLLWAWTP